MKISDITIPNTLYHATYAPLLDNILKNGLIPGSDKRWEESDSRFIYLAVSYDVAESYAETADYPDEWDIVVFKVDTTALIPDKFNIDRNVIDNNGDTLTYEGKIPPSALTLL